MINFAKHLQKIITTILLILLGAFGGYYFGVRGYEVDVKTETRNIEILNKQSLSPTSVDFTRFWEVWDMLNEAHIARPFKPQDLLDGAIEGMVKAIDDPYTSYLPVVENKEARDSLDGKYEGIGAQLGFDDENHLIVVAPLDGSPAYYAGVRAGDRIVEIEGKDTTGISVEEAVNQIRGDAGTVSTLTMFRDGAEDVFEVKIVRDTIKLDSVTWEDKGDGIAYIRLSRFGGTTDEEWSKVAGEVKSEMPKLNGVILDVRNNPGGYLESSIFIASEFISKGTIVKERFTDGTVNDFNVDHKGVFTNSDIRIAVLINQGSASASEIVAGALKELRGAVLVGQRSFGKGTVQKSEEFSDGAAFHVTIAKWLTPEGNWIDSHSSEFSDSAYNKLDDEGNEIIGGLMPDYEVEFTDEDVVNENDVQLNKAIEVLKEPALRKIIPFLNL